MWHRVRKYECGDSSMSDNPTNQSQPEEKKSGKKIILLAIVVIVLLAGAGSGFYFWKSSSTAAAEVSKKRNSRKSEPAEGEEGDAFKNSLPNDEDVKNVVELPAFIVNLADTEQARYLRMTVSLGIDGPEGKEAKPDQLFTTRVRNAMLTVLSDKKSEEILSVEGKAKLRKELLQAAQAASDEPMVHAIYITDFIVQL